MNNAKKIISVMLFGLSLLSCSKSPADVVARCAEEFEVPGLSLFDFEILLSESGVFESPKYHFKLVNGDLAKLVRLLEKSGFNNWKSGELIFDGTSFGWDEKDLKYAQIKRNGSTYYVAVSQDKQTVVFVRYP
jgi:hypothetical protein